MKTIFFLLLFSLPMVAQRPVAISLERIVTDDSDVEQRKFTLHYRISNLTDRPAAFFLNPQAIVPVVSSSGAYAPHFKLYKDGKSVDLANVFTWGERLWKDEKDYQRYVDSVSKEMQDTDLESIRKKRSEQIEKRLMRLLPKESVSYQITLRWDRDRYRRQDEHEYFLDENSYYELELSMHLQLEEFENRLLPEELERARKNPEMITGWFTSNRLAISFGEKVMP